MMTTYAFSFDKHSPKAIRAPNRQNWYYCDLARFYNYIIIYTGEKEIIGVLYRCLVAMGMM